MAARFWGGVAGWLVAVLPLLVVNALDYFGVYYFPDPVVAGLVALVGGLLLGGFTAALLGGNRQEGARSAAPAGAVAAILYAASLFGLLYVARGSDAPPSFLSQHPIRVSAGILFFTALLLLVALTTGALTSKRRVTDAERVVAYPARGGMPVSAPRRRPPAMYSGATSAPAASDRTPYGQPSGPSDRNFDARPAVRSAARPRVYAPEPPPRLSRPLRGQQSTPNSQTDYHRR